VSCHDKIVQMAMQKQIQLRVSRQPINVVPVDGSVRVAQSLICGSELILIDFVMHYGFVRLPKAINPTVRVGCSVFLWPKSSHG
jgi:hypothetical protein